MIFTPDFDIASDSFIAIQNILAQSLNAAVWAMGECNPSAYRADGVLMASVWEKVDTKIRLRDGPSKLKLSFFADSKKVY